MFFQFGDFMIIIDFNAGNEIIISKFENFFKTSLVARGGLQDVALRPGECIGMSVMNRRIGSLMMNQSWNY